MAGPVKTLPQPAASAASAAKPNASTDAAATASLAAIVGESRQLNRHLPTAQEAIREMGSANAPAVEIAKALAAKITGLADVRLEGRVLHWSKIF